MPDRTPRVTLGFTTYNVARYLPLALDSILAQDFTDFEIVVCDNASTDDTWSICQEYAGRDPRMRIYRNERNLGESGNFARVVAQARGEYFRLCAHDDLLRPSLLRECVAALDAAPAAVLASPMTVLINSEGDEIGPHRDVGDLWHRFAWRRVAGYAYRWNLCNEVFGLIRTDVLRRTRLLGPFLSSDVRMLTELAQRGAFRQIAEPLFLRRMHEANTVQGNAGTALDWLEPTRRRPASTTRGTARRWWRGANPHHTRMTFETARALVANDLPLSTRLSSVAAYLLVWGYRQQRTRLWRWRNALRRALVRGRPAVRA